MNQNPNQFENIDEIMSHVFNSKETEEQRYKRTQKEILEEIFE